MLELTIIDKEYIKVLSTQTVCQFQFILTPLDNSPGHFDWLGVLNELCQASLYLIREDRGINMYCLIPMMGTCVRKLFRCPKYHESSNKQPTLAQLYKGDTNKQSALRLIMNYTSPSRDILINQIGNGSHSNQTFQLEQSSRITSNSFNEQSIYPLLDLYIVPRSISAGRLHLPRISVSEE